MKDFPIPKLERMPARISPCPILEAVLEIRYVSKHDWTLLPGLLYNQIKDRYPKDETLPISELPEELLRKDPAQRNYLNCHVFPIFHHAMKRT